jgi:hypothetical protein
MANRLVLAVCFPDMIHGSLQEFLPCLPCTQDIAPLLFASQHQAEAFDLPKFSGTGDSREVIEYRRIGTAVLAPVGESIRPFDTSLCRCQRFLTLVLSSRQVSSYFRTNIIVLDRLEFSTTDVAEVLIDSIPLFGFENMQMVFYGYGLGFNSQVVEREAKRGRWQREPG